MRTTPSKWEMLCNWKEASSPTLCLWQGEAMLPKEVAPFVMRAVDAEGRAGPSDLNTSMPKDDAINCQVSELFDAHIRDNQKLDDIRALDAYLPDDPTILRSLGGRCLEEARKALHRGLHMKGRRLDVLGRQFHVRAHAKSE